MSDSSNIKKITIKPTKERKAELRKIFNENTGSGIYSEQNYLPGYNAKTYSLDTALGRTNYLSFVGENNVYSQTSSSTPHIEVSTTIKVATPTYKVDIYRSVSNSIKNDIIDRKLQVLKDPYSIVRDLNTLIPNHGLYGYIVVVNNKADKTKKKKYTILFPTNTTSENILDNAYSNFMVTSLSLPQREIMSVEQGFGDYWDVHFYGKSPIQIAVGGLLLDVYNPVTRKLYNWAEQWYNNYNLYFRGGAVAKQSARTYFIVGNYIFSGYIFATNQAITRTEGALGFSFNMLVTGVQTFSAEAYKKYIKYLDEQDKKHRAKNSGQG